MATAASQTATANQTRRKLTEDKLQAVAGAIQQMQRRRLPVTYPAIAACAGVSCTFLYDNPSARDLISTAITRASSQWQQDIADRDAQAEASWQQRALNAEQTLKTAHAEIRAQRARIGELLGQLRDTQHEHDSDAFGRLSAENATLRQRIRDIAAGQRTLEERLQAARCSVHIGRWLRPCLAIRQYLGEVASTAVGTALGQATRSALCRHARALI